MDVVDLFESVSLGDRSDYSSSILACGAHDDHGDCDDGSRTRLSISTAKQTNGRHMLKIEDIITLEHLRKLQQLFYGPSWNGSRTMDLLDFTKAMNDALGQECSLSDDEIMELFMKIDFTAKGCVDWSALCNHMHLQFARQQEALRLEWQVSFNVHALSARRSPHRDAIVRVRAVHQGAAMLSVCRQGTAALLDSRMLPTASRLVVDQSYRKKTKWVMDFALLPLYNKIIVGTGDGKLRFFELSTFEPYCQFINLESIPLRLDCSCSSDCDGVIVYGDSQGCVNIFLLTSVGESLRCWRKGKHHERASSMPLDMVVASSNVTYIRWKVHDDWVSEIKYYPCVQRVISSSNHAGTALVIGCTIGSTHHIGDFKEMSSEGSKGSGFRQLPARRQMRDETVFPVHKGVKTFDFCKDLDLLVTGGLDGPVRMWNPLVPGCTAGVLKGHRAPICYVAICQDRAQIFSVDSKSCVKVWNVVAQTCIGSVSGRCNGLVGSITACAYLPTMQWLCMCADSPVLLVIQNRSSICSPVPTSHMKGVSCIVYNGGFRHIISCSLDSLVKVWDLETGRGLFKFVAMNSDSTITCMTLDNNGRRLILGAGDGSLKIWNYNIGQCLCSLQQKKHRGEHGCVSEGLCRDLAGPKKQGRKNEAICDCTYLEINKKGYVISVGCDRRIHRFVDCPDTTYTTICPQPLWSADLLHGHRDDIIVLAHCPPDLLASGACDGEIIVWNFVSGRMVCRLRISHAEDATSSQSGGDLSVRAMVFLKSRMRDRATAGVLLVSSQDRIRCWNISEGGRLFADFQVGWNNEYITCLGVTSDDRTMFAANVAGSVYGWNIMGYAYGGPESNPPQAITHWRAHLASITSLVVISEYNLVTTTSLDRNVRLWSTSGELVGTFGQVELWDISSKDTWQNPSTLQEIQEPQNLRHNPLLTTEIDKVFLPRKDGGEKEVREHMVKREDRMEVPRLIHLDENVAQGTRQKFHANIQIARLGQAREKHFTKRRPINPERVFHHLTCHPLVEAPIAQEVAYRSRVHCRSSTARQEN